MSKCFILVRVDLEPVLGTLEYTLDGKPGHKQTNVSKSWNTNTFTQISLTHGLMWQQNKDSRHWETTQPIQIPVWPLTLHKETWTILQMKQKPNWLGSSARRARNSSLISNHVYYFSISHMYHLTGLCSIASSSTRHLPSSAALLHILYDFKAHNTPVFPFSALFRERQGDRRHSTMLFAFPYPTQTVNIMNVMSHTEFQQLKIG